MRAFALATALIGAVVSVAPASAAVGQCYDAYGRPIGQAYDTNYPNYALTQYVRQIGGSCVAVSPGPGAYNNSYGSGQYYDPMMAGHSSWCGTNPPSGYCMTRDRR